MHKPESVLENEIDKFSEIFVVPADHRVKIKENKARETSD